MVFMGFSPVIIIEMPRFYLIGIASGRARGLAFAGFGLTVRMTLPTAVR